MQTRLHKRRTLLDLPIPANMLLSYQFYSSVQHVQPEMMCRTKNMSFIVEGKQIKRFKQNKMLSETYVVKSSDLRKTLYMQTFNSSMSFKLVRGRPFHWISFLSFEMMSIAIRTFKASYTLRRMFFSSYCCCF